MTTRAPSPIHIDDLARPRLPRWLDAANLVTAPFARNIRFDADDLLARARARTGLDDFGAPSFEEPFHLVVRCSNDAPFSPLGRIIHRAMLLGLLETRLRVEALIAAHPEILEEEIAGPIVIAGLPRTGTTHLFNLVSQHRGLRSLPYWESLEPIPGAKDRARLGAPDPRIRRCARNLTMMNRVMPLFPTMHEFEPEIPHEEVQLQMQEFSTSLYESMLDVPAYGEWYAQADQRPHYAYLKRMLKVCQFLRGGRRWVLKSPQHLAQLPALFATFPDARVVRTHRDPARVVVSLATMIAYGRRMTTHKDAIDPHWIGNHWASRIESWLRTTIESESQVPSAQLLDVRFQDFMQDDVATAESVLEWADEPAQAETTEAIQAFANRNVRNKHGTIDYRYEDLGLDPKSLRDRFRSYDHHFNTQVED